MSDRIIFRTGEALVAGGPPFTAAEPEVVIGELDGPVGTALATLTGDQSMGHSKVFAILNTDIQVRPVTLCVSKVTDWRPWFSWSPPVSCFDRSNLNLSI